jgi:hypothetical protein
MKMFKQIILCVFVTVFVGQAQASKKSRAAREMAKTVSSMVQSLPEFTPGSEEDEWPLKRFLLRTQFKYGIEIPVFAKFELVPELELVFLKE